MGLAKLGLDKLSFNILSISSLVPADTTSIGIKLNNELLIINLTDVRADVFQIPNFAKPKSLCAKRSQQSFDYNPGLYWLDNFILYPNFFKTLC